MYVCVCVYVCVYVTLIVVSRVQSVQSRLFDCGDAILAFGSRSTLINKHYDRTHLEVAQNLFKVLSDRL